MILRLLLVGMLVLGIPTQVYASDRIDIPVTATYNSGKYMVRVNDKTYKTSVTICAEEGYNNILTEEQKEKVKTGHDIETDIYIRKSTGEEESAMIDSVDTITKDNLTYSIDISIVNTIDGEKYKVTEVKEPIEFNIDVSGVYDKNKKYKLISRHDISDTEYTVRVIDYVYDQDKCLMRFMSDKFSTFSLIDITEEASSTDESSGASTQSSQSNNTTVTVNQDNSQDTNNQSDYASAGAQTSGEPNKASSLKKSEQSTITESVKSIVSIVSNYLTGDNSREHILCVVVIIMTGLIIVVRLKRR